jgi:hypothetical protein
MQGESPFPTGLLRHEESFFVEWPSTLTIASFYIMVGTATTNCDVYVTP